MSDLRCVECGYPESRHAVETKACPSGKKRFATMALPEGYACRDCYAFLRFCKPIIGKGEGDTTCDYFPVRFAIIPPMKKGAEPA